VGVFLRFFGQLHPTQGANPMSKWLKLCLKLAYHPSFRALGWLSSISGTKIMDQKPKMGKNFYPHKR